MESIARPLFVGLNTKIITREQSADLFIQFLSCKRKRGSIKMGQNTLIFHERASTKKLPAVQAVSSGVKDTEAPSSQFEDFSVTRISTDKSNELKISVEVSGAKTEEIFDNVFSKMVADAQPIPGFRRMKGGKTPDIPRDILLQVLGYSKVYEQVIKKIINSAVAEYVEKEGLTVTRDLRVEQSFEDLEATFEPGDKFCFDAIIHSPPSSN